MRIMAWGLTTLNRSMMTAFGREREQSRVPVSGELCPVYAPGELLEIWRSASV